MVTEVSKLWVSYHAEFSFHSFFDSTFEDHSFADLAERVRDYGNLTNLNQISFDDSVRPTKYRILKILCQLQVNRSFELQSPSSSYVSLV